MYIFERIIVWETDFEKDKDGVVIKFDEKEIENTLEFSIYGWFRISKKIQRTEWATGY